jgi:hypothetical protein
MATEQEIRRAVADALAAGLAAAQRSAQLTHTLHQNELSEELYKGEMAAVGARLARLAGELTERLGVRSVANVREVLDGEQDLMAVATDVVRSRRAGG